MLRLTAVACAALLFAGCLGGSSPSVTPAATTPEDSSTAPTAADATAASGAANASAAPMANASALRPTSTPVAYSGSSEQGACVFVVVAGECQFPDSGHEGLHKLALGGAKPLRLTGTVTWTSQAPGTSFFFFACKPIPDGFQCPARPASGVSPVKLDIDLSIFNATDEVTLIADNEVSACCPVPVGGAVFAAADFKVDAVATATRG